jgi:putative transposase
LASTLRYKRFYRRHLPHIQAPGATLFVTFRLAGSLPRAAVERLLRDAARRREASQTVGDPAERRERTYVDMNVLFGGWDAVLDEARGGPSWLARREIAAVVARAFHDGDGSRYDLVAFCIMPNHVHAVFTPLSRQDGSHQSLSSIMRLLKGRTAREANLVLGRRGAFWEHENYDHVVRDQAELHRIVAYVLGNPVKAGLADRPEDWEWSYSRVEV